MFGACFIIRGAYFITLGACFITFKASFIILGALFIRFLFLCMRCYLHCSRHFVTLGAFIIIFREQVFLVIGLTKGACSHLTLVPSFVQSSRPRIHIRLDHQSRKEYAGFSILSIRDGGFWWRGGQDGFDGSHS